MSSGVGSDHQIFPIQALKITFWSWMSWGGELEAVDGMTPLDVVVRILNNQPSSLMWIDEKAEEFSSRIQKVASQGSAAGHELMDPKFWKSLYLELCFSTAEFGEGGPMKKI
ncbi:nuclear pore complex protein NUP62-like [Quercus lobata]|uniref:nuclear pore complex protein NUP62-like n=1 Tax=Quercus lobata TaxID=97700 RepID=UPI0012455825|nr:nuclear pore complex protein NUP62-like [Quercus lobata]